VAIGFQRRFAEVFGVEPERVELEHVGLNHLSWERAVRVDGVDRLAELLRDHAEALADDTDVPADLIRALGAVPSYYLHYYYAAPETVRAQRTARTRAEEVMEIEADLLELYRDPSLDRKPELLERRGGAFYSEAAAQLIASLYGGTDDVQVVNVRNGGAIANLDDDAVIETPARIDRDGAHPVPLAPLEPHMQSLVAHVKAYERLAIRAATTGDRRVALKALLTNPLVPGYRVAVDLLDALLEANREHLPLFFGAGASSPG
jgi:6-phospho-beta-glucosidase